jgi:tubulin polyglutamylase TTLL4
MHLTNFSLNKNSQRYKAPSDQFHNDLNSSKQLYTNVIKSLSKAGKDVRSLQKQIKEVAQKTVIALEPYLKNAYHCFISTDHNNSRSF